MIAADLDLNMHLANVCKTCFFWFRQVRRIRRSVNVKSVKTLFHSFVLPRIYYCNSGLASAPNKVRDKMEQVQNAAALLITAVQKHGRGLSRLLRDDLHWLTIPQWVQYKLAMTVHRCHRYRAPRYLADLTAACQSPKFLAANIIVLPVVANWIFRGFVAAHLALGFLSRRPNGLEFTVWFVAWSSCRVWML